VFARAGEWPESPALIEGRVGRTLTYGALADFIARVSAGLSALGVRKGDTICMFSPNVPEYAASSSALRGIGVVVTAANAMYGAEELARQVGRLGRSVHRHRRSARRSRSRRGGDCAERATNKSAPGTIGVIVLDATPEGVSDAPDAGTISFAELVAAPASSHRLS